MKELERLRREQSLAREERDGWFKAGREARGEEEQHRADMRGLSDKMDRWPGSGPSRGPWRTSWRQQSISTGMLSHYSNIAFMVLSIVYILENVIPVYSLLFYLN